MKKLLLVITFFLTQIIIFAQPTVNPVQMKSELDKRGLSQTEVETRLRQKGIDINNVKPENAVMVQGQIEQVLKELEAEKKAKGATTSSKKETKSNTEVGEIESLEERVKSETKIEKSKIEDVVKEKANDLAKTKARDITKAVKEGATVEEAIGEELIADKEDIPPSPIYGMNQFRDGTLTVFKTSDDVKATDAYVVGVGDELNVSLWGIAEYAGTLVVSKDGYIQPERMPRIYVKGLPFAKVKDVIRSNYARYYPFKNEQFAVTVNYKRTITVNIYGEVLKPGGFSISAVNTAFNALVAAGGPSDIGSVRNIKLIRAGEKPRIIDVYEFANDPSARNKFYLEDDDIIQVPISEKVVEIKGGIKRPFRYELLQSENLIKLIAFAGGLTDNAYYEMLQVKRFINDKEVIIDVNYKNLLNTKSDFILLPGDVIVINKIPKAFENFASISGAVDFPKEYEISAGMKISDLVKKAVLQKEARTDIAFLQRLNPDQTIAYQRIPLAEILANPNSPLNVEIRGKDKLLIYAQENYTQKYKVSVEGAVRTPKEYPYDPSQSLKVEDLVLLAGGLKPDATEFAYIVRINPNNEEETEYVRINIKDALTKPTTWDNTSLKPFDKLIIPSATTYTDIFQVKIAGAVRAPGEFRFDESLTIRDLLVLSGGLKLEAATNRIEVSRVIFRNNEPTRTNVAILEVDRDLKVISGGDAGFKLQPFDQVIVRAVPEFKFQQFITLEGEVRYPGSYALVSPNEQISNVIERAGGLTAEAFTDGARLLRSEDNIGVMVMDLTDALKNDKTSKFNYIMKEGDVVSIPKRKDFVTIKGATKAVDLYPIEVVAAGRITVPHHDGKRAMYYVNQYAAGIGKEGKKARITVLQANGRISRTTNLGFAKIYPKVYKGAEISVGYKDPKKVKTDENGNEKKEDVDWAKIISNGIAQSTGVITLILAIQTLSK